MRPSAFSVGYPRPFASGEHSAGYSEFGPAGSTTLGLLLLEPRDSPLGARIEDAARAAGLSVSFVDDLETVPSSAPLVGIGPSATDTLPLARRFRARGAKPLLLFFSASAQTRDELRAELLRDPLVYPRFELIELSGNVQQLTSRLGRVTAQLKRHLHPTSTTRHHRTRSRGSTSLKRLAIKGEQYLAHFLSHTPDAILSTDKFGHIEAWNDAAQRMFGFDPDAILGKNIMFLDHGDVGLGDVVKEVAGSGEPQQVLVSCMTVQGESVQVAASVAPIRDTEGAVLGVSVIARDDSEYQRVQDALREANRQKDEFLAIMSHELRTPLTSILGYTDMLLRGLSGPLPPMTNRYVGNVRTAGDRLLDLVNGLLDYTRLEAGVERLELKSVDLSELVVQAVQRAGDSAAAKSIDLSVVLDRDAPAQLEADRDRLSHVMDNLLSNALKFTPAGGQVHVQVGSDPERQGSARVSVTDSGIGLREEQIARVWERFYQVDSSLTRPYGGMGLGLSIARHVVTLHGGTVGADSGGPGRGSTFWFSLPQQPTV